MRYRAQIIKSAAIYILAVIVVIAVVWELSYIGIVSDQQNYIRGKYGTKCYEEGYEHKNIKIPLVFDSKELCEKSLKK